MKLKYIKTVVALFFLFSLVILIIVVKQKQQTRSTAVASGPLRVLSSNPRFFADGNGKAVYLAGEHTWTNLQDRSYNPPFDYTAYLDMMSAVGQNLIRMWSFPLLESSPQPWLRPGDKIDFNTFDEAYFTRLRTRVQQARDRGIYVSVMLTDGGWSEGNCAQHLFNPANNVNGIGNGSCSDVQSGRDPAIIAIQKAYFKKVVDTVDQFDNVLYEISNESGTHSVPWQYDMITYLKGLTPHPVGMTCVTGADAALRASPADWISPCDQPEPPVSTGEKVIINDSDHFGPETVDLVWKNFMRAIGFWGMDHQHQGPMSRQNDFTIHDYDRAMGHTVRYAKKMNLAAMTPHGDLTSTGYALANPGSEYLVYNPGGGSFSVTLQDATYEVEWFDPSNGQVSSGESVKGGGSSTFNPPFSGQAVLYLKNTSITGTPTSTTGMPSLANYSNRPT
jgi:hypothetical protein